MTTGRRGQVVPRGIDKWLLRVYLGKDAAGKHKYASKMFTGKHSLAQKALTAMHREKDTDTFVPASRQTVGEFLTAWLGHKISVSPRTLKSYRDRLALVQQNVRLSSCRLTDLDASGIRALVSGLVEQGYAPRTIRYTVTVLRLALEDAVRDRVLVRNPTAHVQLPAKVKRAASVFTDSQAALFLELTAGDQHGSLWRFLLTTGLRPGEALALGWDDVNLDDGWVSVRRALTVDPKGQGIISSHVKADSQRRIALPSSTVESLRGHRQQQAVAIMASGPRFDRQGLVFPNPVTGKPLCARVIWRVFKQTLKVIQRDHPEFPTIRLYDTRHTHLTSLLTNGADIAWVAARAGHADIKMTRDHYAHVMPEAHRDMAAMTERILQQAAAR